MKKCVLFILSLFLFLPSGLLLPVEVSEQQDIAIFGLTQYSYNIPDEALGYVDSSIKAEFIKLKRFNVLGYG